MNKSYASGAKPRNAPSVVQDTHRDGDTGNFEVNVVVTEPKATTAALKTAGSLASGLGAAIRVRAGIVVPVTLPLDQPLVSVEFVEQVLSGLVAENDANGLEHTVHLYICRNWTDTLLRILKPGSIVVIGGRQRMWPTGAVRMAKALRSGGMKVVLVDSKDSQSKRRTLAR